MSNEQILEEFSSYLESQEEFTDFFNILLLFEEFIPEKNYYKFNLSEQIYCKGFIKELVNEWGIKIKNAIN